MCHLLLALCLLGPLGQFSPAWSPCLGADQRALTLFKIQTHTPQTIRGGEVVPQGRGGRHRQPAGPAASAQAALAQGTLSSGGAGSGLPPGQPYGLTAFGPACSGCWASSDHDQEAKRRGWCPLLWCSPRSEEPERETEAKITPSKRPPSAPWPCCRGRARPVPTCTQGPHSRPQGPGAPCLLSPR